MLFQSPYERCALSFLVFHPTGGKEGGILRGIRLEDLRFKLSVKESSVGVISCEIFFHIPVICAFIEDDEVVSY